MQQAQLQAERAMLELYPVEKVGIRYFKDYRLTVCGIGGHATVSRVSEKPSKLEDFKSCLGHCLEHYLDAEDL